MKKKRKNKKNNDYAQHLSKYQIAIQQYKNRIWTPEIDIDYNEVHTNSWFSIKKASLDVPFGKGLVKNKPSSKKHIIKAFKVNIFPNSEQQKFFTGWFNACTKMYNSTLKFIKEEQQRSGKLILNFKKLRTYYIKGMRDKIKRKTGIFTHVIDNAIKLACSNYKSALTNLKRGNIKYFRIRYWKYARSNKVIDIEPQFFKSSSIPSIIGPLQAQYNGEFFDVEHIHSKYKKTVKFAYHAKNKQWSIWIPEKEPVEKHKTDHNFAVLDPGSRKFMTGLSENEVFKIADNCSQKIGSYLKRIDDTNKIDDNMRRLRKQKTYRRKIENNVNDLHWKTIKFLTDNYGNIIIGDMSVKKIISNERSGLPAICKRILSSLRLYQFKCRLKYKCEKYGMSFNEVDERYTSKVCSNCGKLNANLGSSEIFKCPNCNLTIDRDVNGSRGIYIKQWL